MRIFALPLVALPLLAQSGDYVAPKLPDHIKLNPPKVQTQEPQQARAPRVVVVQKNATCAHILVYKPPKIDEKMIIGGSQTPVNSNMPAIPGMPVCPEDVRQLPQRP